jgi:hypothetical protein
MSKLVLKNLKFLGENKFSGDYYKGVDKIFSFQCDKDKQEVTFFKIQDFNDSDFKDLNTEILERINKINLKPNESVFEKINLLQKKNIVVGVPGKINTIRTFSLYDNVENLDKNYLKKRLEEVRGNMKKTESILNTNLFSTKKTLKKKLKKPKKNNYFYDESYEKHIDDSIIIQTKDNKYKIYKFAKPLKNMNKGMVKMQINRILLELEDGDLMIKSD